jgi:hypothetical protein
MSNPLVRAPRLPTAPVEYDAQYMASLISTLRLYFNGLDNPGAVVASTQNINNEIVTALSFSQPGVTAGTLRISLPTQVDQAAGRLKTGDVYYDTTSFVLKVAP